MQLLKKCCVAYIIFGCWSNLDKTWNWMDSEVSKSSQVSFSIAFVWLLN